MQRWRHWYSHLGPSVRWTTEVEWTQRSHQLLARYNLFSTSGSSMNVPTYNLSRTNHINRFSFYIRNVGLGLFRRLGTFSLPRPLTTTQHHQEQARPRGCSTSISSTLLWGLSGYMAKLPPHGARTWSPSASRVWLQALPPRWQRVPERYDLNFEDLVCNFGLLLIVVDHAVMERQFKRYKFQSTHRLEKTGLWKVLNIQLTHIVVWIQIKITFLYPRCKFKDTGHCW